MPVQSLSHLAAHEIEEMVMGAKDVTEIQHLKEVESRLEITGAAVRIGVNSKLKDIIRTI
jgi:hypothetical protein